jgi:carboxymethylenebutenolidase
VRVLLSLFVLCLVAGCGSGTSPETPDAPQSNSEADFAEEAAPATIETEAADTEDEQVNPLIGLLEQDIPYGEGVGGNLMGFLAMPEDAAEPLPGIIVLHEWWGLNNAVKEAARRLAREGYIVLATDFYGGRTAESVPEAQALMRELVADPDSVRDNIRQAVAYLQLYALAPRIGSIGWDMGGHWSLQTGLMMPDELDALVMFYGAVETEDAVLDALDMPLLALFGEQDASIPLRGVQDFRNVLGRLGKEAEVRIYSGADHGFFFPDSRTYSPIAADDAWNRTTALFEAALKN